MGEKRIYFCKSVVHILICVGGITILYYISKFLDFIIKGFQLHPIFDFISFVLLIICFFVIGGAVIDADKHK